MTMIVQKGTVRTGSILIVGDSHMKVSKMKDDQGRVMPEGKPGDAV
jgi:translation initiation factor IF-2